MLTRLFITMRMAIGLICILTLGAMPARAEPPGNKYVHASLISDVSAVQAGKPFTLGVLLKITPGWHVYWKNPGDSGLPTKVSQWRLPEGFRIGELRFPIPQYIELPGNEVNYGYENEVLLMCEMTPPENLKPGESLDFSADVSWLVCQKVCVPGRQTVSLNLSASEQAPAANEELFSRWKALLPVHGSPSMSAVLSVNGASGSAEIDLTAAPKGNVQFFPLPPDGIGVTDTQLVTAGRRSTYTFKLVPEPKDPRGMQVLAVYTSQDGSRHGVMIGKAAHQSDEQ